MPRGGARSGAGRPSVLTAMEKLAVGAACERLWNEELNAREEAKIRARLGPVYASLIDEQRAIPVAERAGYLDSLEAEERAEEIEEARRNIAAMEDDDYDEAPRLISVVVSRPYGKRDPIIQQVAAWASNRFGKRVSERQTRECWDLMRSAVRESDNV